MSATAAIDLDGTLARWDENPEEIGAWIEGAREALAAMRDSRLCVVIHSCRSRLSHMGGYQAVATFLRSGGFVPFLVTADPDRSDDWSLVLEDGTVAPYPEHAPWLVNGDAIGIWHGTGKPVAAVYIDDRAITFDGNWPEIVAALRGGLVTARVSG